MRCEKGDVSLRLSPKELAAEAGNTNRSVQQSGGLPDRHETEPIKLVEKAKWLEVDDLFFLGFHFAENTRPEKEFGSQVLRLLMKLSPRSKQAKDAKSKLRSPELETNSKKLTSLTV